MAVVVLHLDRAGRVSGTGKIRNGVAARTHPPGDPLHYWHGAEYRDLDALQEMANQLPGKPLVSPHPDGMISKGAKANIVGRVRSARVDGDLLRVELEVSPEGELAIQRGNRELSVGYDASVDANRYQTKNSIDVDHLALIPAARCGRVCSVAHGDSMTTTHKDHAAHKDEYLPGTMPENLPTTVSNQCNCGCANCTAFTAGTSTGAELVNEGAGVATIVPDAMLPEMPGHDDAKLNAAGRKALSAKEFAVPSRDALPINDEGHVKAAMARFNQTDFSGPAERKSAYHRIIAKAHELGIDPKGFMKEHGAHLDDDGGDEGGGDPRPAGDSKNDAHPPVNPDIKYGEADEQVGKANMAATTGNGTFIAKAEGQPTDFNAKLAEALKKYTDLETRAQALENDVITNKLDAKNAQAEARLEKMRADKAEKERDDWKERADKAEKMAKDASDKGRLDADTEFVARVERAATARANLLTAASEILGAVDEKGTRVDRSKSSDRDLKVAIIQHVDHDDSVPEDALIDGMYQSSLKRAARVAQVTGAVRAQIATNRLDGVTAPRTGKNAEDEARDKMRELQENAYLPKNSK